MKTLTYSTMKTRIFRLAIIALTLALAQSCSNDDESSGSSNSGSNGSNSGNSSEWSGTLRYGTYSSELDDNTVEVVWSDTAVVSIAQNLYGAVSAEIRDGHVAIIAEESLAEEVTYNLSGSSSDGSLYMAGSYKSTFTLDDLTLANPDSAAISIVNGKRINIKVPDGTASTLTDGSSGSQKGCLYVKGHAEFKGKGTLNVSGKYAHAIKGGEYMTVKNCTINVLAAVKDGINCNEYFLIESGSLNISGVGDDGIQCDLDGDTSTGATTDHEDEDSGNIYIEGGTVTATITAAAAKGVKAAGDMYVSDGAVVITTSGSGAYDSDDNDAKGCAGLKADGNMTLSGGTLTLKSTGSGGKCIKCDGALTITDDVAISASTTGSKYSYGSYTASPKCIKADGALTVSGGSTVASSTNHEGIESKSTITVTGGHIYSYSYDDAINSGSHFYAKGGYICAYSTGNDGLDSNCNCYIQDGIVYAIGKSSPEVAIDANTEKGYKLYITGGTVVAVGGLESGASLSQSCYATSSWSKSKWYALYSGSEVALAFETPSSGGSTMVVSTSGSTTLKYGVSVAGGTTLFNGMGNVGGSVSGGSTVSLSSYSSGNRRGMW
ncbi:MAG: carbohydrate-binding domain-containing protein [Bacteroidaceae bacterium]|nr:carbohydrate-binding domain-containing protein [Bacteroidaceae bacterium]